MAWLRSLVACFILVTPLSARADATVGAVSRVAVPPTLAAPAGPTRTLGRQFGHLDLSATTTASGPGIGLRDAATVPSRTASLRLGSVTATGGAGLGGNVRLTWRIEGVVALFHATQAFDGSATSPFRLCGSESFLTLAGGLDVGRIVNLVAFAEVQDDPFHFRWAGLGDHAGVGCAGLPPAWTSSERLGIEASVAVSRSVTLSAGVEWERQRLTVGSRDGWRLYEADAAWFRVGVQVRA